MPYTTGSTQIQPFTGDGVYDFPLDGGKQDWSFAFKATGITGSAALSGVAKGGGAPEDIEDDTGTQVVIDLAAPVSVSVSNKALEKLTLTITGSGGAGNLEVTPSGG